MKLKIHSDDGNDKDDDNRDSDSGADDSFERNTCLFH